MKIRPPRYTFSLLLCCIATFGISLLAQPNPSVQLIFLQEEKTFIDAQKECMIQDARVPNLGLLIQLARFGRLPHTNTDYWSSFAIGSFAFGWSTRTGMLSFDHHSDIDHVVCFQEK